MNLFDILEGRMQQLFEGNRMLAPLPFKKLAKRAVREMKRCSVKMNGRRLAPTLYTVLVNQADDQTMAPLYQEVTDELVDFLSHEAANAGLELEAAPIVRFIAEANVKPGKPDVIAEVVTADVLEEIRREESAYALAHAGRRPAAADGSSGGRAMLRHPGAAGQRAGMQPANAAASMQPPASAPMPAPAPAPAMPAPMPSAARSEGFVDDEPLPQVAPTQVAPRVAPQQPQPGPRTCQLTDTASGRTWRIATDRTVIGREQSMADLILTDTNVSRRHAELTRGPQGWALADLGSTNGTRVNGQRLTAPAALHSGDIISLGLMQLAFQEL